MTAIVHLSMIAGTSTTEGEASYVLSGAVPPFLEWDGAVPDNTLVRYLATDGEQFEEGRGVYSSAGTALSRATILQTSAGDTSKIDWGTGTREIRLIAELPHWLFANDLGFLTIAGGLQWEGSTKKYRIYQSSDGFYISDSTEAPFAHLLKYNPDSTPDRLETEKPFRAPSYYLGSVAFGNLVTLNKASEEEAHEGTSDTVVMTALRVAQALLSPDLLIAPLDSQATAAATMQVAVLNASDELERVALSAIKTLMNAPDYTSTGNTVPAGAGIFSWTHSLGAEPAKVEILLRCTDAGGDVGYAQGDAIVPETADTQTNQLSVTVGRNATTIYIVVPATMTVRNKSTYSQANIDKSKWALEARAWK